MRQPCIAWDTLEEVHPTQKMEVDEENDAGLGMGEDPVRDWTQKQDFRNEGHLWTEVSVYFFIIFIF